MRLCKVTLLILTLLAVGCAPAPADEPTEAVTDEPTEAASEPTDAPESTDAPTPTDEPTEAPTLEATEPPVERVQVFGITGSAPAIEGTHIPDYKTAQAGAIIFHEGLYYTFFAAFPETEGGETAVGYATSPDGVEWTAKEGAILTSAAVTDWDGIFIVVAGVLVEENEGNPLWVMYVTAWQPYRYGEGRIYRATAPTADGPWTFDADPVLERGEEGDWDDEAVWGANVVKTDDGYLMVYGGDSKRHRSEPRAIGVATSDDGINWTKYDDPATTENPYAHSDPVLTRTVDTWEDANIGEPHVQVYGDGYIMLYGTVQTDNERAFGLAYSDDGIHWQRDPRNPVLIQSDITVPGFMHTGRISCEQDDCFLLVELVNLAAGGSHLWRADSLELLNP